MTLPARQACQRITTLCLVCGHPHRRPARHCGPICSAWALTWDPEPTPDDGHAHTEP